MVKTYHILNGDALKEQLPRQITGQVLIMRECLVEGEVQGRDLEDLFEIRAHFISSNYKEFSKNDYYCMSVAEIQKMQNIPKGSEINLWFEDDLFCQVNLWFVLDLLKSKGQNSVFFLLRPSAGYEYGFCGMDEALLMEAYGRKKELSLPDIHKFSSLWKAYQVGNYEEMVRVGKELGADYPFLMPAIEAHGDRSSADGSPGRPEQAIIKIMHELQTTEFPKIFREFRKRESIYGFGDLQVKRLLEKIINENVGIEPGPGKASW